MDGGERLDDGGIEFLVVGGVVGVFETEAERVVFLVFLGFAGGDVEDDGNRTEGGGLGDGIERPERCDQGGFGEAERRFGVGGSDFRHLRGHFVVGGGDGGDGISLERFEVGNPAGPCPLLGISGEGLGARVVGVGGGDDVGEAGGECLAVVAGLRLLEPGERPPDAGFGAGGLDRVDRCGRAGVVEGFDGGAGGAVGGVEGEGEGEQLGGGA